MNELQLACVIISALCVVVVFLLGLLVSSYNNRIVALEEAKAPVATVDLRFAQIQDSLVRIGTQIGNLQTSSESRDKKLNHIAGIVERRRGGTSAIS